MLMFVDCEFNDFQGELISMALVTITGQEFYEVLECKNPSRWVKDNVMPVLGKKAVSKTEFQQKLHQFLNQFDCVEIVADWPEDVAHFCQSLITGPGMRLNTPSLNISVVRFDAPSQHPHNALADAKEMASFFLTNYLDRQIKRL